MAKKAAIPSTTETKNALRNYLVSISRTDLLPPGALAEDIETFVSQHLDLVKEFGITPEILTDPKYAQNRKVFAEFAQDGPAVALAREFDISKNIFFHNPYDKARLKTFSAFAKDEAAVALVREFHIAPAILYDSSLHEERVRLQKMAKDKDALALVRGLGISGNILCDTSLDEQRYVLQQFAKDEAAASLAIDVKITPNIACNREWGNQREIFTTLANDPNTAALVRMLVANKSAPFDNRILYDPQYGSTRKTIKAVAQEKEAIAVVQEFHIPQKILYVFDWHQEREELLAIAKDAAAIALVREFGLDSPILYSTRSKEERTALQAAAKDTETLEIVRELTIDRSVLTNSEQWNRIGNFPEIVQAIKDGKATAEVFLLPRKEFCAEAAKHIPTDVAQTHSAQKGTPEQQRGARQ